MKSHLPQDIIPSPVQACFHSFIPLVMEHCRNSIVYDEYMLDTLVVWLVGFTDSQVRAFRHTCTVACELGGHTPGWVMWTSLVKAYSLL